MPTIQSEYESLLKELNAVQAHASRLQQQIASQGKDYQAFGRLFLKSNLSGNAGACATAVSNAAQALRQSISYGKQLGKPSMATTLTALLFDEQKVTLAHAGNTRLYAIRGGFINQITKDQTTYEWLKSIGNLEGAQACNKSEIRCALGGGNPEYLKALVIKPAFERKVPGVLMFTTDGVHDYVSQDEMEEILEKDIPATEKIREMIDLAATNGSEDDRSVILVYT